MTKLSIRFITHSSFVIHPSFGLRHCSNSQRTKLFERELSFDVGFCADGSINECRARAPEQDSRNCAKFADPHRAHWKIDLFLRGEIEQMRELNRCVGARRDFKNICAM